MGRFLAGVASALLLIGAGVFLWSGLAGHAKSPLPGMPTMQALASPAEAEAPADPPQATDKTREQKRFDRYDRNRDGKVDRDEYLLARHKAFAKLDTNGDGKLSFDEYAIKTTTKFTNADADKSGVLNATEFATTKVVRKSPRPRCPPAAAKAPAAPGEDADEG
jgi:hypothetical protein